MLDIIPTVISETVNNTFIGTALAGGLLAYLGIRLYRSHKNIDSVYDEEREIKSLAVSLNIALEKANKNWLSFTNTFESDVPQLNLIVKQLNPEFKRDLRSKIHDQTGIDSRNISDISDSLLARLKITNTHQVDTETLSGSVTVLALYLIGVPVLPNFEKNQLDELKTGFSETLSKIQSELRKILAVK